ncbi:hypothetical protein OSB04_020240, partial [Centaurea solstitialis]
MTTMMMKMLNKFVLISSSSALLLNVGYRIMKSTNNRRGRSEAFSWPEIQVLVSDITTQGYDRKQVGSNESLSLGGSMLNVQMHVEFAVLKHIIVEIVWMLVTVAVKHAYVFLQGLLDIKMNAPVTGIGKHMMAGGEGSLTQKTSNQTWFMLQNAQVHVEFVVQKRIILEIVLIHVSVVVMYAYVFLRDFLDTKMNALATGIGKQKKGVWAKARLIPGNFRGTIRTKYEITLRPSAARTVPRLCSRHTGGNTAA